jgi:hypothetical protein
MGQKYQKYLNYKSFGEYFFWDGVFLVIFSAKGEGRKVKGNGTRMGRIFADSNLISNLNLN